MNDLLVNLKAVLSTTPQRWHQLTQNFPDDLLRRAPLPGEWSALDVLMHLMDTDRKVFPNRVRALLAGEDFPAFNPDTEGARMVDAVMPQDLAAEFEALRTDNLRLLDQVTPADFERRARHSELGMVTLSELLHEWGAHDLMHLVQAEQALMQPFIEGCQPWRPYFVKHIATAE